MKILIVGCGDIGTRHLQAVVSLPQVTQVEICDPRPEGLALGKQRLKEVSCLSPSTTFRWIHSLEEASPEGDLCIVATQARGRCQITEEIALKCGYKSFFLEKTVAQSVAEYERLLSVAEKKELSVWVNCKTRAYPFHRRMKQFFDGKDPIQFCVFGGNHGLVLNGIHSIDLFTFYDESHSLIGKDSKIDLILHPSKRGKDIFDLSGTLNVFSDKGSTFTIDFSKDNMAPPFYTVFSKNLRFTVDHWAKQAFESCIDTNWSWRPVPFETDTALTISTMSRAFVDSILTTGKCELPTLADCYPAHAYLLKEVQPVFVKLMGKELEKCPIT